MLPLVACTVTLGTEGVKRPLPDTFDRHPSRTGRHAGWRCTLTTAHVGLQIVRGRSPSFGNTHSQFTIYSRLVSLALHVRPVYSRLPWRRKQQHRWWEEEGSPSACSLRDPNDIALRHTQRPACSPRAKKVAARMERPVAYLRDVTVGSWSPRTMRKLSGSSVNWKPPSLTAAQFR